MQTVADMRGVGVKNREKFADVLTSCVFEELFDITDEGLEGCLSF